MKIWVPDVHKLTVDILSSILLVDYNFLSPYYVSGFYDSVHKCCVAVLYSHLSFGIDVESRQSDTIYYTVCVCVNGLQDVQYDQIMRWWGSNICQGILKP